MKLVKHRVSDEIFDLDDVDQGMVRCRKSGEFFDPDETIPLGPKEVIGCGLREGNLMYCDGCAQEHDKTGCRAERKRKHLSPTRVAELGKEN